jgi:hypothetical protein
MSGQAKNHPLCTAGDNSQTWTLIDKSAGNHVCIKPGVDWNSYTRFQIEASSFAPANERAVLKTQDAQKLTALLTPSSRLNLATPQQRTVLPSE